MHLWEGEAVASLLFHFFFPIGTNSAGSLCNMCADLVDTKGSPNTQLPLEA